MGIGDVSMEEYQGKRSDLVGAKLDLKEKEEFLKNFRAQAIDLEKSYSNRQIFARKVLLSIEPPFSFLAEAGEVKNFRRGRDSNSRYKVNPRTTV